MEDGVAPNGNDMNYKFNNAYQNLRHSFERSLKVYGTIEYLFEALAALFIALDINSSQIFFRVQQEPWNIFLITPDFGQGFFCLI